MKIALLADIHANADALAAVLRAASNENATSLIIAGDFVGYYYEPHRVMQLLSNWSWIGVRGNHEEMLRAWCEGFDRNAILSKYGHGIARAAEELSSEEIRQLLDLPHPGMHDVAGHRVCLCHGSPRDIDAYVYPDASNEVRSRMTSVEFDVAVFGHTHYPVVWRMGESLVVNPGSVGQPRDRKPGACWALWDTDTNDVSLRRETYDTSRLVAQASAIDAEIPFLSQVLIRCA